MIVDREGERETTGTADNAGSAALPRSLSGNQVTALVHLYRAEVGRMTMYRVRLDTTTNWAITTSALIATFALGNPSVPHAALLVLMLLNYFFLHLEARRFRAYELSHQFVQVLERHFYQEILDGEADLAWRARLADNLRNPSPPISRVAALGWRLRRNYLWIYVAVLVAWLSKLDVAEGPVSDLTSLVARAAVGSVPGWVVCALVALLYAYLISLAVTARRVHPLEDD